WDEIPHLLTADAVLDLTATSRRPQVAGAAQIPPIVGVAAIRDFLEHQVGRVPDRLHICTMPEITFRSDTEADGIWRQESNIPVPIASHPRSRAGDGMTRDRYRKAGGRWLVAATAVTVDLMI